MPRTRNRVATRARHKKIINRARGHRGKRHKNFKVANESVMHALRYSTTTAATARATSAVSGSCASTPPRGSTA